MKRLVALVAVILFAGAAVQNAAAQGQPPSTSTTYVVQAGENLYRIGLKFNLSPAVIARANGIVNPNLIIVGQRLIIPASGDVNPPPIAASATPGDMTSLPPTSAPPPVPSGGTYTVQPGDNLYRISLKVNSTIFLLAQLNGLTNPNLIYVGQVLRVPGGGLAAVPPGTPGVVAVNPAATVPAPFPTDVPPATAAATQEFGTGGAIIPASSGSSATASNVGFALGVVTAPGAAPADLAKSVTDLGASWVKAQANWKTIEATQGTRDYTALDATVGAFNSAGLKILLTVTNAPDWARATNQEDGPPTDSKQFAAFVSDLATRYKGKVQAYEIWSEPNLRRNWNGRPLGATSYLDLLKQAYAAVKSADGSALVISAGLAPTGFNDGVNAVDDRVFLQNAYTAGLAAFSDAIGAHPNGWANPPDATCCQASPGVTGWFNSRSFYFRDTLSDYRQIMKKNNASGTFIWVTAFGWGSNENVAPDASVNDTKFGFVKLTSQAKQAQYLTRGFEIGRDLAYVGPMFADNLNACQAQPQASGDDLYPCYYSMLDAGGKPRPVYDAVKALRK